jgi:glutamate-ammonia-ligase adenylyltransferase
MSNSLSDKALLVLELYASSPSTSIDSDLFQIIKKSLKISSFVTDVINDQESLCIEKIEWHNANSSDAFRELLQRQLGEQLFNLESNNGTCDQKSEKVDLESQPNKHLQLPLSAEPPSLELYFSGSGRDNFQQEANVMRLLRSVRRCHSAAIATLELAHQLSIEESSARMSILAEVLIQTAYAWSYACQRATFGLPASLNQQQPSENLLVVAMGKLGGMELNFSSDIDLIFFYLSDGETQGGRRKVGNSRFFQKVGIQLIKLLNESTEDGFVFRVDMRLRPYGDSGNLVMSIAQAEDYYHEQGRGWERFAMVRAKVVTGSSLEQQALYQIITPFAFRRYIDYGVIDSLRNMKSMIQREVRRRGLKGNIKLGAGGIREIEFMVQSLQLIQGGRNKRLQEKSVLKVLPLLVEEKLLPKTTSKELASNYQFLRRLEHCLQELEEKQTQQLPSDDKTQMIIADVMGFAEWNDFERHLNQIQENTNTHFNALFGEEKTQDESVSEFFLSLWEGHIDVSHLVQKYVGLESEDADSFLTQLSQFRDSHIVDNLSSRGAKRLKQFLPKLLAICLDTEQPQQTLGSLLKILKAILKRTAYLELLSENLPILQHLVDLVSRSQWIANRLAESPLLFDELLYPNSLYEPLTSADLQNELRQNLLRIDESDTEQLLDAIRSFKQINELRVAAALLSERLSISQVSRYLTQLAQVIIDTSMQICWRGLTEKYGWPQGLLNNDAEESLTTSIDMGFAVIAYGKLGGTELGFNSDLDLVFLFNQPASDSTLFANQQNSEHKRHQKHEQKRNVHKKSILVSRFYTRFAQKLIHFLSTRTSLGILYEVDMRLRPSGNSGLLVSHIDAFSDYQKESAWTWEHQALCRARTIAGDQSIANRFKEIRKQIVQSPKDATKLRDDVINMRKKMRKELLQVKSAFCDLKQCEGGLVDIEFLAQFLLLNNNYQKEKDSIDDELPSNTVAMIKYIVDKGSLDAVDGKMLSGAYRSYRNCLNEMALVSGQRLIDERIFVDERESVKLIWEKVLGE